MTLEIILEAKVGSLGDPYSDGTPNLEIKMSAEHAAGQSFVMPKRTAVTLRVDGKNYDGSVLANKPKHRTVWFSPTLLSSDGKRHKLGRVLTDAGFRANDDISLAVSGTLVEVMPTDNGPRK